MNRNKVGSMRRQPQPRGNMLRASKNPRRRILTPPQARAAKPINKGRGYYLDTIMGGKGPTAKPQRPGQAIIDKLFCSTHHRSIITRCSPFNSLILQAYCKMYSLMLQGLLKGIIKVTH
jgi:hypothetical protein